ncbi:MAG: aspartyl protease family protein [bacterium]
MLRLMKIILIILIVVIISSSEIRTEKEKNDIALIHGLYNQAELIIEGDNNIQINFDYIYNIIIIKCSINNEEYRFVLDTGAESTIIDGKLAKSLELKEKANIDIIDRTNTRKNKKIVIINSLKIASMKFKNKAVVTTDISRIRDFGFNVDGIIGSDILRFFIVTLNYEKKVINFSIDKNLEIYKGRACKIPLKSRSELFYTPKIDYFVKGNRIEAIIDTGSNGYISFPREIINNNIEYFSRRELIESRGSNSFSVLDRNYEQDYILQLHDFRIGNLQFEKQVVKTGSYGLIGNKFLENFKVIINYLNGELVLIKKHENIQRDPYYFGFSIKGNEEDEVIVSGYWEGSPAEKAGIQIGDKIIKVNGRTSESYNLVDICEIVNSEEVKELELLIENKDGKSKILLEKDLMFLK